MNARNSIKTIAKGLLVICFVLLSSGYAMAGISELIQELESLRKQVTTLTTQLHTAQQQITSLTTQLKTSRESETELRTNAAQVQTLQQGIIDFREQFTASQKQGSVFHAQMQKILADIQKMLKVLCECPDCNPLFFEQFVSPKS